MIEDEQQLNLDKNWRSEQIEMAPRAILKLGDWMPLAIIPKSLWEISLDWLAFKYWAKIWTLVNCNAPLIESVSGQVFIKYSKVITAIELCWIAINEVNSSKLGR